LRVCEVPIGTQMARICRKPVSSAFYASDFPPLFKLGPSHSTSLRPQETSTFEEARSEGNNSSGATLQSEELTIDESHSGLLDHNTAIDHNRSASNRSNLASSVPRILDKTKTTETVSELPVDDHYRERSTGFPSSSQQNEFRRSLNRPIVEPLLAQEGHTGRLHRALCCTTRKHDGTIAYLSRS
jgi:hypothetical protein